MNDLEDRLRGAGAALVGYADLQALPAAVRHDLPFAISIAVALDPQIISCIARGPTSEYYAEYQRANRLLNELTATGAGLLQEAGRRAVELAATDWGIDADTLSTQLPHKTVATRAAVGWIGKCALLVTREYGSAVRISTILTDAAVPVAEPVDASSCGECKECVRVCPGGAPSGRDWRVGMRRDEFFDAHVCRVAARRMAARAGIDETICGMCIAACPWTRAYIEESLPADQEPET